MERLSSERFSWEFGTEGDMFTIVVTDHQQSRTKKFKLSNNPYRVARMTEFMNSMTDELLEGYWPREKPAKKQKEPK